MTPLLLPGLGVAFATPWGLALGAGAAAGLVALHAVTVGRPRPAWLPTARFAPERPPRAARRLRRPSDLGLLALRVLAALAAGAALARPVPLPARQAVRRVVLADRSRAADPAAVRAAVLAAARPGDVLVPFDAVPGAPAALAAAPGDTGALRRQVDSALAAGAAGGAGAPGAAGGRAAAPNAPNASPSSTPNASPGDAPDAGPGGTSNASPGATPNPLGGAAPNATPGPPASLSAALVAARRLAPGLAAGADSLELVLVSPLAAEEADAATASVRAAWAGRARVVRVAVRAGDAAAAAGPPGSALGAAGVGAADVGAAGGRATRRAVTFRGAPPDDALAAALALAGVPSGGDEAPVRVVRGRATDADRAWALGPAGAPAGAGGAAAAGRVLVDWPADGAPAGARALGTPDTTHALVAAGGPGGAGAAVAVAPFVRRAVLDEPPGAGPGAGSAGRVVARWADGRPAADERAAGAGCVRRVAVAVPQAGDAALRAGFRALLPALLGPCGGARDFTPLPAASVAMLIGRGPLLAARPLRAELAPPAPDRLGAALLGLALLALVGELALRGRARSAADALADEAALDGDASVAGPGPGGARGRAAAPGRARAA